MTKHEKLQKDFPKYAKSTSKSQKEKKYNPASLKDLVSSDYTPSRREKDSNFYD